MTSFNDLLLPVVLAAAAILVAFAFAGALYRLFRRPGVRIICFLALFSCGVALYYETGPAPQSRGAKIAEATSAEKLMAAINQSLSIFFPSRGAYEDIRKMTLPDGRADHARRMHFLILHYLAYFYFAAIVFSFFGARTADRLWAAWFFSIMPRVSELKGMRWLRWNRRLKHIYVFWGVSEESETLADSLAKDKSLHGRCLFVLSRELWHEKERYAAVADRLAAKGHRVVWEDLDADGNWYESAGRHFFLGADEKENAKLAAMLVKTAVKKGVLTLDVYVRGRTPKEIDGINIHHVDHADNAARCLLNAHPAVSCGSVAVDAKSLAVKGECRMLLIGFGEIGQAVLKQHLLRSAFPGLVLKTDVIGGDAEELASFKILHPGLFDGGATGEIALHAIAPASAKLLEWVAARSGMFDRIVICPEPGVDCIKLGERLVRVIGGPGGECAAEIFAYDACNESTKRRAKVKTFGKIQDLYTRELVVDALRIEHLPAALMEKMGNKERAAWRKTFCHNATDRMLDMIALAGFRPERTGASDGMRQTSGAGEFVAAVNANRDTVAAAFGAARRAFMAWKGLPEDKYAETDCEFARDFFELFDLAKMDISRQDA